MPDTEPHLIETLQRLYPVLKEKRQRGWVMAVLAVVITVGVLFLAYKTVGNNEPILLLLPTMCGIVAVMNINAWVIRVQQRLIMPHLAKAVQLEYQQDATHFLNAIPHRLLPRVRVRKAEDCITGNVGGREMSLAEVKFETGGKNSRTVFNGFVVRFQNVTPLPAFFITQKRNTVGWFTRIDVDDLVEVTTITAYGYKEYGVWLTKNGASQRNPALKAVLDVLTNLETQIGADARLYSATSTGEEMYIALNHEQDLFRIGGLLANLDKTADSIQVAFEELNIPLEVVSVLLEAERRADQIKQDYAVGGTSEQFF